MDLRIALQKPCSEEPTIADFRERLFGKHGIVPDLKYSHEWKVRLRAIQSACSPNEKAFRTMDYSSIRFDSESEPARKIASLLLPIALVLAAQSTDKRLGTELQKRSADILKSMSTQFCVTLGLYADLSALVSAFLRKFDTAWHDCAHTDSDVDEFTGRLGQRLFKFGLGQSVSEI